MSNIWHDIDADRITPTDFFAVVEIKKGSKNKYELDKKTGLLRLDRPTVSTGFLTVDCFFPCALICSAQRRNSGVCSGKESGYIFVAKNADNE